MDLIPYISLDYLLARQNKFLESGASSIDLHVMSNYSSMIRMEGGVFVRQNIYPCTMAEIGLSAVQDCRFNGSALNSQFVGTTGSFTVFGLSPSRIYASPSLTITGTFLEGTLTTGFSYKGLFAKRFEIQNLSVDIAYNF